MHHMDVKTALLSGLLDEDIDMVHPDGFIDQSHPDFVCKLKRSLYRSKQSPRMWNKTIDEFMLTIRLKKCESDHYIYSKRDGQVMMFVALYVNDLVLASSSNKILQDIKQAPSDWFEMTNSFAGDGDRSRYRQNKFAKDILSKYISQ